jgi:hypothetical protein
LKTLKFSDVFGHGNSKLGNAITFSLPAVDTCPGASEKCKSVCYATKGCFTFKSVEQKLQKQWKISQRKDFADIAIKFLSKRKQGTIFRIHPAGDFYDLLYAVKWWKIIKNSPHITFWCYTRSWRVSKILPALKQLAKLPNCHMWFSCDEETGKPSHIPENVRLAYVSLADDDIPSYTPDLFFRDYPLRGSVVKHISGTLVCPPENGISHNVQCSKCRICLTNPKLDIRRRTKDRFEECSSKPLTKPSKRTPLQLVG